MSSSNGTEAPPDLLKSLSLSEVIQKKDLLENEMKALDDRQGMLEKQKDDMLNINKVFRNWLTHLQKVSVCLAHENINPTLPNKGPSLETSNLSIPSQV